jgi:hypothetical protein
MPYTVALTLLIFVFSSSDALEGAIYRYVLGSEFHSVSVNLNIDIECASISCY